MTEPHGRPPYSIQVAEAHPAAEVLGPGNRFVLWVQGCGIGCRGCISPQWIPFSGGRTEDVTTLADRISEDAVDGLTISGGEPFAQAEALAELAAQLRARRDLSLMSYSGYTIEHIRAHGSAAQHRLLATLDILIDGPYLPNRQANLRWRGSANQRIHFLTDRHADLAELADISAGIQFEVGYDASVRWLGVPAVPNFRERLEQRLGLVRSDTDQEETKP
jgi:anaerobic ribonucleoside-triphosphate reductase activating protein